MALIPAVKLASGLNRNDWRAFCSPLMQLYTHRTNSKYLWVYRGHHYVFDLETDDFTFTVFTWPVFTIALVAHHRESNKGAECELVLMAPRVDHVVYFRLHLSLKQFPPSTEMDVNSVTLPLSHRFVLCEPFRSLGVPPGMPAEFGHRGYNLLACGPHALQYQGGRFYVFDYPAGLGRVTVTLTELEIEPELATTLRHFEGSVAFDDRVQTLELYRQSGLNEFLFVMSDDRLGFYHKSLRYVVCRFSRRTMRVTMVAPAFEMRYVVGMAIVPQGLVVLSGRKLLLCGFDGVVQQVAASASSKRIQPHHPPPIRLPQNIAAETMFFDSSTGRVHYVRSDGFARNQIVDYFPPKTLDYSFETHRMFPTHIRLLVRALLCSVRCRRSCLARNNVVVGAWLFRLLVHLVMSNVHGMHSVFGQCVRSFL